MSPELERDLLTDIDSLLLKAKIPIDAFYEDSYEAIMTNKFRDELLYEKVCSTSFEVQTYSKTHLKELLGTCE